MTTAAAADEARIPDIDFGKFIHGDEAQRREVAQQIGRACTVRVRRTASVSKRPRPSVGPSAARANRRQQIGPRARMSLG